MLKVLDLAYRFVLCSKTMHELHNRKASISYSAGSNLELRGEAGGGGCFAYPATLPAFLPSSPRSTTGLVV